MRILKVIPATRIPLPRSQVLSYFSNEELPAGSIVKVPLRNQNTKAIVVESGGLEKRKQEIKRSSFELKKINSVVSNKPVYSSQFFELLFWASAYWWESAGLFVNLALPRRHYKDFNLSLSSQDSSEKKTKSSKSLLILNKEHKKPLEKKIKSTLAKNKKVLSLYPEIFHLTENTPKSLQKFDPLSYHSKLSAKKKFQVWSQSFQKEALFVRGTKKTLLFPWRKLGLIIVNEEENSHYKSWGRHPKYHGKHLAFKLAQLHDCPLVLTSYGPSVGTFYNFKNKNYQLENDDSTIDESLKRNTEIFVIDRTKEKKWNESSDFSYLSSTLLQKAKNSIKKKGKVLFLHPRRGSFTSVYCQDCGHFLRCPDCSVTLNYHDDRQKLQCHYCGRQEQPPATCPKCKSHRLKYSGTGTEKIEKILQNKLADFKGLRLDSDSASTQSKKKEIVEKFSRQDYDYILGTQMILSTSLSNFDLIVILNIDLFLDSPDFQAHAKTMSMLKKLEQRTRTLLMQTYNDEQETLKSYQRQNYENFYQRELKLRGKFIYPPFCQLIKLENSHKYKNESLQQAKSLKAKLSRRLQQLLQKNKISKKDVQILGPSPGSPSKKRGAYHHQLTIKAAREKLTERNKLLEIVPSDWEIDVEPEEM